MCPEPGTSPDSSGGRRTIHGFPGRVRGRSVGMVRAGGRSQPPGAAVWPRQRPRIERPPWRSFVQRVFVLLTALVGLLGATLAPVAAQDEGMDNSFSDTIISTL